MYTAVTSPEALLLIVVGVTTAGLALRSTAWSPRIIHPLRRRRAAGQVMRAGWTAFREHLTVMLAIGALFVPAAILEIGVQALLVELTRLGHLAEVAGEQSVASGTLALLVAGAGHALAATVVVGGVALVLGAVDAGRRPTVREAYRMLARVWPSSARRSSSGWPSSPSSSPSWASRSPSSCSAGGRSPSRCARWRGCRRGRRCAAAASSPPAAGGGPRASRRSSTWGAASGPVVGIVLLFVSDLPLETVNAVSSAVFVAVMPFVGASMAFLYGSLVARSAEPREESPRPASRVWWPLAWARRAGAPGGGT